MNQNYEFELLTADKLPKDIIGGFTCGNNELDKYAYLHDRQTCRTYCFVDRLELVAIASVSCTALILDTGYGYMLYPAIEINAFAMRESYQKVYIPDHQCMLSDLIFSQFLVHSKYVLANYCHADYITLYSIPEKVGFYERNGFKPFIQQFVAKSSIETQMCIPMFLNLADL